MKDFCVDLKAVTISNEIDLLIQQIDMIFDTNPTEVFGEEFGSEFYNDIMLVKIQLSKYDEVFEKIYRIE